MDHQIVRQFKSQGLVSLPLKLMDQYLPFLSKQASLLLDHSLKLRPWYFWELHNPWSRTAMLLDSWVFLDICQSNLLVDAISPITGEDVILYDSQFSPDLESFNNMGEWLVDADRCPVEPLEGLCVRIPIPFNGPGELAFEYLAGSHKGDSPES